MPPRSLASRKSYKHPRWPPYHQHLRRLARDRQTSRIPRKIGMMLLNWDTRITSTRREWGRRGCTTGRRTIRQVPPLPPSNLPWPLARPNRLESGPPRHSSPGCSRWISVRSSSRSTFGSSTSGMWLARTSTSWSTPKGRGGSWSPPSHDPKETMWSLERVS